MFANGEGVLPVEVAAGGRSTCSGSALRATRPAASRSGWPSRSTARPLRDLSTSTCRRRRPSVYEEKLDLRPARARSRPRSSTTTTTPRRSRRTGDRNLIVDYVELAGRSDLSRPSARVATGGSSSGSPGRRSRRGRLRARDPRPLRARAFRRPVDARGGRAPAGALRPGASSRATRFERGSSSPLAGGPGLADFLFRVELDPATTGRADPLERLRAGLPAVVLPLEQMPDDELFELARSRDARTTGGARRAGAADAEGPEGAGAGRELRRPVAAAPAACETVSARPASGSPTSTSSCAPAMRERDGAVLRRRRCARTAASSTCSTPTSPSSTSGWRGTTASRACRATEFRRVDARRPPPRRRADAGERPDGDLEPDAHLAGEARQVGAGADPGHAAAAAAAGRRAS